MENCQATFRWTRNELVRAMQNHNDANLRPSIVFAVGLLFALLAALALGILITAPDNSPPKSPLLLIGAAIYWFFLRRPMSKWRITRGFDKRPDANALVTWDISEKLVRVDVDGLSSSEMQWNRFVKVVKTDEGFLFYSQKNLFIWLPYSAFENLGDIKRVDKYVEQNGVPTQ